MSTEDTLIQVRREKHQEANNGSYLLANSSCHQIKDILSMFDANVQVSINPDDLGYSFVTCGRVIAFRKSGSITFIKIADSTGNLQVIASKASFEGYNNLRLIDLGDIVEVTGKLCLSKTNEQSLLLVGWKLLTKSHKPPPEKFSGLSDTETKYRKRYLDLLSSDESRALFTVRSYAIRAIRNYLESNGFLEVETSTLNTVNSGANAKPFTTHHNALDMDLYLRIAPELYLKRLLVGGLDRVFEIGRNYRNEGVSTRHNPEFTMMEFYQAYANFSDLLNHSINMFNHIENYLYYNLPKNIQPYYDQWRASRTFTFSNPVVIPMIKAVQNAAAKHGLVVYLDGNSFTVQEDSTKVNIRNPDLTEMWNELKKPLTPGQSIAVLFEYLAEPYLVDDYRTDDGKYSLPVYITDYPKDVCPLARTQENNTMFCDRFELYIDGRELANAFQELNDPDEQSLRFKEQLSSNDKDPMDYDADYVNALQHGMPPAIGFGMGIDRLVMLLTNAASIKDVILFPTMKPVK